jgi:hypothetical protein
MLLLQVLTTLQALQGSSSSFLNPALGFASNLSHTIIREAHEDDDRSVHSQGSASTNISITDEELALLGAPWAKEGMLCRKQYWDSAGKRAKTKSWMDVFVVISRGELNMFTFGDHGGGGSSVVGGGNWLVRQSFTGCANSLTCVPCRKMRNLSDLSILLTRWRTHYLPQVTTGNDPIVWC